MSDKGGQLESIQSANGHNHTRPRTRGQRVKGHCGRRWWIYLIIFLIVVLAVVLGIIFGAVPKIAQDSVNSSTITVDGIALRNPTNDNFTLDMNSTVHADPPTKSHFDPQTFELYLPPTNSSQQIVPFMTLSIGRVDIAKVVTINVTNVETQILDKKAYGDFSTLVLNSETLELGMRSHPKLYVGSLKVNVDYQKTVQLKGLNGLKGITLTNARVLDTPLDDGTNMLSDCVIPNPSTFTLEVGDLTVDVSVGGLPLGYSVIKNLTLRPGDNHVTVNSYLVSTNALVAASLKAPNVNVLLTANSTVFNGQHIEWLENPLKAAPPVNATLNPS